MPSYLITGPSREHGIALEFVRQISSEPSNTVFGVVRDKSKAGPLLLLAKSRKNVLVIEGDITCVESIKNAAKKVAQTSNNLDVLIHAAAYVNHAEGQGFGLADHPSQEDLNNVLRISFEVNTIGSINLINTFLPLITNSSLKKVVCLSTSIADAEYTLEQKFPLFPDYTISKAALNFAIVKYAADPQLRKKGVKFLALHPGLFITCDPSIPLTPKQICFLTELSKKEHPDWEGRILSPEESVRAQLEVIEKLDLDMSGSFLSYHGDREWV